MSKDYEPSPPDGRATTALAAVSLDRASVRYASCFCEENIWHLAHHDALAAFECWVVFIANEQRACAFSCQRNAPGLREALVWDYHVMLAARVGGETVIFDLDSTLDFPVPARKYLDNTFPIPAQLAPRYAPLFRVIPAQQFIARFASDRSHMRAADGSFIKPPPPWPEIKTARERMNLDRFIDIRADFLGQVLDLAEFKRWLGETST